MGDKERLRGLIRQLMATPEERSYAIRELYKSGPYAIPDLVDALAKASDAADRLPVYQALDRMGTEALAPMIAALESDNTRLKLDLLGILERRHFRYSRQIVP